MPILTLSFDQLAELVSQLDDSDRQRLRRLLDEASDEGGGTVREIQERISADLASLDSLDSDGPPEGDPSESSLFREVELQGEDDGGAAPLAEGDFMSALDEAPDGDSPSDLPFATAPADPMAILAAMDAGGGGESFPSAPVAPPPAEHAFPEMDAEIPSFDGATPEALAALAEEESTSAGDGFVEAAPAAG